MIKLIIQRLFWSVFTLFTVSIIVFLGTEVLPGDVAQAILGQSATPESLASLRSQLGLDRPAYIRYFDWSFGIIRGDLGISLAGGVPISGLIMERLGNTLLLAGVTAAVAVPFAIVIGLLAAMYPGSTFDRMVSMVTLFLVSMPEFLIASFLVLIFAVHLGWLPAISYTTDFQSIKHLFVILALPILTLSFVIAAGIARMTRATILNIMDSLYIEMALLKGNSRKRIVFKHALVNIIGPLANIVALNLTFLIGGVVIAETIFSYPGLAKLIVDAVLTRDFPVVQACALVFSFIYIILILAADIAAVLANPKLTKFKDNKGGKSLWEKDRQEVTQ